METICLCKITNIIFSPYSYTEYQPSTTYTSAPAGSIGYAASIPNTGRELMESGSPVRFSKSSLLIVSLLSIAAFAALVL